MNFVKNIDPNMYLLCIQDQYLVIPVPADGLALDSARPSAGTVLTTHYLCFS